MTTTTIPPTGSRMSGVASGGVHTTPAANPHVRKWIEECVALCKPDNIYYCNGSPEERQALFEQGRKNGTFIRLNQPKLPGSYLHRSNPKELARSENLTFISTPSQDMGGGTHNWLAPRD